MDVAVAAHNNAHKRCRVKLVGPKTRELELSVVGKVNSSGLFLRLGWFLLRGLLLTAACRTAAGTTAASSEKHGKWKLTTLVVTVGDHRFLLVV